MFCGSGGSKSRLATAAGAKPSRQMRNQKLHAAVARSRNPVSDHFWQLRCRKSARRCGRSTFPSQNVQNTPWSDHFWKLRCSKSACRCGAKHISKSKVQKIEGYGALLEVEMFKKCTALGRKHIWK